MSFNCNISFYNKKQKCIRLSNSDDYLLMTTKLTRNFFNTPNEYRITMQFILGELIFNNRNVSFIEVVRSGCGTFMARHFVRLSSLSPLISFEEIREKCPYIREQQLAASPFLNWNRIISDSMFGRIDKTTKTPRDYVK